jgi:hypothetical protein
VKLAKCYIDVHIFASHERRKCFVEKVDIQYTIPNKTLIYVDRTEIEQRFPWPIDDIFVEGFPGIIESQHEREDTPCRSAIIRAN